MMGKGQRDPRQPTKLVRPDRMTGYVDPTPVHRSRRGAIGNNDDQVKFQVDPVIRIARTGGDYGRICHEMIDLSHPGGRC